MNSRTATEYRLSSQSRWKSPAGGGPKVRSFHLVQSGAAADDDHLSERISLPRGWYAVPDRPERERFWDGHRFVAARPAPVDEQPVPEAAPAPRVDGGGTPSLAIAAVVCGVFGALITMFVAWGLLALWWAAAAAALGAATFTLLGYNAKWVERRRAIS
jgi:hypothetical protein